MKFFSNYFVIPFLLTLSFSSKAMSEKYMGTGEGIMKVLVYYIIGTCIVELS